MKTRGKKGAALATKALRAASYITAADDRQCGLTDLLCDLFHYAHKHDLDWYEALHMAEVHCEAERALDARNAHFGEIVGDEPEADGQRIFNARGVCVKDYGEESRLEQIAREEGADPGIARTVARATRRGKKR